jgi:hypothetical protein
VLLSIAVFKPGDSLQIDMPSYDPVAVTAPEPTASPAEPHTAEVATVSDPEVFAQDGEAEPLVSDLEIEPLGIAALDLPGLEHR